MKKRKIGNSDLHVFPIGLGTMGMSEFYGETNEQQSIKTLQKALHDDQPALRQKGQCVTGIDQLDEAGLLAIENTDVEVAHAVGHDLLLQLGDLFCTREFLIAVEDIVHSAVSPRIPVPRDVR